MLIKLNENKTAPKYKLIDVSTRFKKLEACYERQVVDNYSLFKALHPLIDTVHKCFDNHIPLILSPDMFWLCILQAVGTKVNSNPEKYRDLFVNFEDKKTLEVRRDTFVIGQKNDWEPVLEEFVQKIQTNSKNVDKFSKEFSTTTIIEKAAFNIATMDVVKNYFDYVVMTKCGIPEIELLGTKEDWQKLIDATIELSNLQLDMLPWFLKLISHLRIILQAFDNVINVSFWDNIYKYENQSGGPQITGWITLLFPFDGKGNEAKYFTWDEAPGPWAGRYTDTFPSGVSKVDFIWDYMGKKIDMNFYGGFFGAEIIGDKLKPSIGWAITHK